CCLYQSSLSITRSARKRSPQREPRLCLSSVHFSPHQTPLGLYTTLQCPRLSLSPSQLVFGQVRRTTATSLASEIVRPLPPMSILTPLSQSTLMTLFVIRACRGLMEVRIIAVNSLCPFSTGLIWPYSTPLGCEHFHYSFLRTGT
ncbi:hypothetical protein AMECASPLE_032560, partial [Ameca splendens]